MKLSGQIVDIHTKEIFPGELVIDDGKIIAINRMEDAPKDRYILPGFVDAHVHVESSMLVPSEFARMAVTHGTVGTVSDPHEIANVLGIDGIRFMIENGKQVPFHFFFGASSCVPATTFETAGANVDVENIRALFEEDGLHYLSEMMNYPGVLNRAPDVMEKIALAHDLKRPVDGHSPGLRGDDAQRYIDAGIDTDHECFTLEEGLDKVSRGMKILIREGSAARNFEALQSLISSHPSEVMFCSDDKHPDALELGHINLLVRDAIHKYEHDLFDVLRCACLNPVIHYGLGIGTLRVGDSADFIVVNNLNDFHVLQTYICGQRVANEGTTEIPSVPVTPINQFHAKPVVASDFILEATGSQIRVIEAEEGQLVTKEGHYPAKIEDGLYVSDVERDILKLTVVNRYKPTKPAVAFIRNFGLKRGAIASCVAHDSHNIVAVGTSDAELSAAVNMVIGGQGGIAATWGGQSSYLSLPVAGIMSAEDAWVAAKKYAEVDKAAKALGSPLEAPFMTLSFMALLVIPSLKLSDLGLFDGTKFAFTSVSVS